MSERPEEALEMLSDHNSEWSEDLQDYITHLEAENDRLKKQLAETSIQKCSSCGKQLAETAVCYCGDCGKNVCLFGEMRDE